MTTSYLFRIDAAKDNDAFFALLQPSASHVYAGIDIRIGSAGWVPDLIKITADEGKQSIVLTLIELEATKSEALISCRKYLPESPAGIVEKLLQYLERVISRCRSTADPRKDAFIKLKGKLESAHVVITTAGALRSSADFVEELPLMGQGQHTIKSRPLQMAAQIDAPTFHDTLRLSPHEAKGLRRSLMIVDAIIRKRDHSASTFRSWRAHDKVQPLKYFLKKNNGGYPALRSFLSETGKSGMTLDCASLLTELVQIWSETGHKQYNQEQARNLIVSYFPIAVKIGNVDSMRTVFDVARTHLAPLMEI